MEDISDEFAIMYERAEKCMKEEFAAEQAIVIMTGKNEMYSFANFDVLSGNTEAENRFVQLLNLKNDTEVVKCICVWRDGMPDIPLWHFRDMLGSMNPRNQDTKILLKAKEGYIIKEIKDMK